MVLIEPEARVGDQECLHLLAPVIVDVGAPVLVKTLSRIGVFVEVGRIEAGEAMRVVGEMRGYPIEDEPEPGLVRRVDEGGEILRRAEAARRREQRDRLVTP